MPTYVYRYSVMRAASVEAKDITDAAIIARKFVAGMAEAKLHDIIRTDPPLDPIGEKKADAA
jgi:hypothetical protein